MSALPTYSPSAFHWQQSFGVEGFRSRTPSSAAPTPLLRSILIGPASPGHAIDAVVAYCERFGTVRAADETTEGWRVTFYDARHATQACEQLPIVGPYTGHMVSKCHSPSHDVTGTVLVSRRAQSDGGPDLAWLLQALPQLADIAWVHPLGRVGHQCIIEVFDTRHAPSLVASVSALHGSSFEVKVLQHDELRTRLLMDSRDAGVPAAAAAPDLALMMPYGQPEGGPPSRPAVAHGLYRDGGQMASLSCFSEPGALEDAHFRSLPQGMFASLHAHAGPGLSERPGSHATVSEPQSETLDASYLAGRHPSSQQISDLLALLTVPGSPASARLRPMTQHLPCTSMYGHFVGSALRPESAPMPAFAARSRPYSSADSRGAAPHAVPHSGSALGCVGMSQRGSGLACPAPARPATTHTGVFPCAAVQPPWLSHWQAAPSGSALPMLGTRAASAPAVNPQAKSAPYFDPATEFNLKEALADGPGVRTTVMLRNLPNRWSAQKVVDTIRPFIGDSWNVFYLPMKNAGNCNSGYAFLDLANGRTAAALFQGMHGTRWPGTKSAKLCQVRYARLQGAQLLQQFPDSDGSDPERCRGLLLAPGMDTPVPVMLGGLRFPLPLGLPPAIVAAAGGGHFAWRPPAMQLGSADVAPHDAGAWAASAPPDAVAPGAALECAQQVDMLCRMFNQSAIQGPRHPTPPP